MVKRREKQGRRKERVQAERAGRRLRPRRGWAQPPEAMPPARPGHGPRSLLASLLLPLPPAEVYMLKLSPRSREIKPLGNEEVQPRLGWCRFAGQGAT